MKKLYIPLSLLFISCDAESREIAGLAYVAVIVLSFVGLVVYNNRREKQK